MTQKDQLASKDRRLQQWLNRKKEGKPTSAVITQLPEGKPAVLSSGQQRLWLLQQLYPGNPFYHQAEGYRLTGKIRIDVLIESFQKVVERHDILRTTFKNVDGQAVQQINGEPQIDLAKFNLENLSGKDQEEEADAISISESARPFDLEKGPLVRLSIIQLSKQDFHLIVSMHHIITDKWSMRILREEWASTYQGKSSLPPMEIQYADYSWWQQNLPVDLGDLDYWKEQLAGELPQLILPYDHPRPARPSFSGTYSEQLFSPQLHQRLKALCKENNITMFVLLLSIYKVLLHRYSGQTDLLVGAPVTNRDHTSLENLIGFFNETIVLRSDLSDNPRFVDLLKKVRGTVLDAFAHKNVPFESLVQALKPERYLSSNPLFQVMFLYHKVPQTPVFDTDLHLEYKPQDVGVSKFDLTLYFSEDEDHLSANIEYTSDLFKSETISRMEGHLRTLMEAVVENPHRPISDLPMLTGAEKEQILIEWNDTATPKPEVPCVHQLIEAQAKANPNQSSVVFQGQALTYEALNEQANEIASRLLAEGANSDSRIGLCADRSHDMIIAILGILKTGAAYVPLDPEYPAERLQYMVQDAAMPLILAQEHLVDLFVEAKTEIMIIGTPIRSHPESVPKSPPVKGKDLAYIIYTSGSTARPKGVPINHQNLMYSTTARFSYYQNQPGVFLLLSSFSFDSSIAGIFWSLSQGGTLVLAERRIEQDLDQLAKLIKQEGVTHTLMLPSLYDILLQHTAPELLASLNTVIVAGEACSSTVCRRHFEVLPEAKLYNEYGPTEATVWSTVHQISPENSTGLVPIGRPISNSQHYILDSNLQLVPIGVPGELYIGGSGVAQGYLNQPEMTAARFVPDPFSEDPAARLYHTGDLARYRVDGIIEFLGRSDNQVKIRGYRIEPEEIQEVLLQYPDVMEAVVLAQPKADQANEGEIVSEDLNQLIEKLQSMDPDLADYFLRSVETNIDPEQFNLNNHSHDT